jgi:hypothetical protein
MSLKQESELYFRSIAPRNCERNTVFLTHNPPGKQITLECPTLRSETDKHCDQIPLTFPITAKQKITKTFPDEVVSQWNNHESTCMRTDCPFNHPVGVRSWPIIGKIIRSREKPTELSKLSSVFKSQED